MKIRFVRVVSIFLAVCIAISATMIPCFANDSTELQPFGGNLVLSAEEEAILQYKRTGFLWLKKNKSILPTTKSSDKEYRKLLVSWAQDAVKNTEDSELQEIATEIINKSKARTSKSDLNDILKQKVYFPVIQQDGTIKQTEESITVKQAIASIVYLKVLNQYAKTLDDNLEKLSSASNNQIYFSKDMTEQCVTVIGWENQINKQFENTGKIDFPSVGIAMMSFSVAKATGAEVDKFLTKKDTTYSKTLNILETLWDTAETIQDIGKYFEWFDEILPDAAYMGFLAKYFETLFSIAIGIAEGWDDKIQTFYFLSYYYVRNVEVWGTKKEPDLYAREFDGIALKENYPIPTEYFGHEDKIISAWANTCVYMKENQKSEEELTTLFCCANLLYAAKQFGDDEIKQSKNGLLKCIGATSLGENRKDVEMTETTGGAINKTVSWHYDAQTKVLTISGEGRFDCLAYQRPWEAVIKEIEHIRIQEGIENIPSCAFRYCKNLEEIEIPDSVTSIGNWAFVDCKALQEIKLPDNLTDLGISVFNGCNKLTELELPSTLSNYSQAFEGCTNLKRVVLQGGIKKVSSCAFRYCKNLEEIEIPDSVTSIGNWAFVDCKALQTIKIPDSVTHLGQDVFDGCKNLNIVFLGDPPAGWD